MMPFTTYIIPEPDKKETPESVKWLWIVTDHTLSPSHEDLLQKICQALKADFSNDVYVLICDPSQPVSLCHPNIRNTSLILSFGIPPSTLGIWIDLNRPGIRFLEAFSFVLSVTLDELINHPSSKKQLWSSMQSFIQFAASHK